MAVYTYLRTSTKKQTTERQEYIFQKQGIKSDMDFKDKITGTKADRPALNELKAIVKNGDIVYFVSISRMARNLKDCIEICDYFVDRGVQVKILKEGIDTNTSTYKLLLGIFGAVAEMERDTIAQQVQEGVDKCKSTGVTKSGNWFGQPKKTKKSLPKNFEKAYRLLKGKGGDLTQVEVANMLGIGRTTLYRYIKLYEGDYSVYEKANHTKI